MTQEHESKGYFDKCAIVTYGLTFIIFCVGFIRWNVW